MGSVSGDRLPGRKDKNQNIQVFVRLRPLNARERDIKSIGIVEVNGSKDVIVKQPLSDNKLTKKFSFDKAFGPNSKQVDVYHDVVSPLIEEVLAGYNCTVFAYGQTGTGKTHTMVGESSADGDVPWQNDPMSGIIPRALSQLFDELRITNSEYTVRVSYLELYNEELFDLLSSSEDNSKLRIYEDVTKKGANIVNGLEEMTVYNKMEVYKIMAKGQEKRRMASTLMNAQSSRSHTVFTIVVHMKENSPDGEELMKIGKLNLVDLAGSENISKAGSDNPARKERARECVNINQSLLTLGRVITALVERHPHIPYRESKLTRLLQESLGGRTKTSIIATISPGHRDIEETLSTLEYAYRARNILNKPEVNQKMTKRAVLKEYSEEIDRLKRDLQASRERNGVYLANETYAEMTLKIEEQDKEIQEQILHIKAMKEEKDRIEGLFGEMSNRLNFVENELDVTNQTLNQTKTVLNDKKQELKKVRNEVEEQKFIVSKQIETEKALSEQAKNLIDAADHATNDINLLHNTVEKKKLLESNNLNITKSFNNNSQIHRDNMKTYLQSYIDDYVKNLSSLQENIDDHHANSLENQMKSEQIINEMFSQIQETILLTKSAKDVHTTKMYDCTSENFNIIKKNAVEHNSDVNLKLNDLFALLTKLNDVRQKEKDISITMKTQLEYWKTSSAAKIVSLTHATNEWWNSTDEYFKKCVQQRNLDHDNDLENCQKLSNMRKQHQKVISEDLNNLKSMISQLESKLTEQSNECIVMENEQCESLARTHNSFKNMLQTANADLHSKMQDTNNIIMAFEDTNEEFIKEFSSHVDDCSENTIVGFKVDEEIKVSVDNINGSNKKYWSEITENIDLATKNVNDVVVNVIEEQHRHHNEFLAKCQTRQDEILQPINLTIKRTSEQKDDNSRSMNDLKHSINAFREKIHEDLIINDNIESKFLNEEYKLYSPTGKTPIRKEYRYPKYLASTSPHDRLLARFKNSKIQSPESDSIIELDQSSDLTPSKVIEISQNNSKSLLDDSVTLFIEPKPLKLSPNPNGTISKSCSDSDLNDLDKQCKENLNNSTNDKKEYPSRLKQPSSNKKVLTNKNS